MMMRSNSEVMRVWAGGVLWSLGVVGFAAGASIPEPETVLYGKVLVRSGGQDYVMESGVLEWGVKGADGRVVAFSTALEALAGGAYSYELRLPHSVASLGLGEVGDGVLPLAAGEVGYEHFEVRVDGERASIVVPGERRFAAGQTRRAQTLRVDLRVGLALADSDGDGMADWWEEAYGFDAQLASDAGLDGDGDGLTNLAEFLGGTSPVLDNRVPELLTGEVTVYGEGTAGVVLQAVDRDSEVGEIVYRVTGVPEEGRIELAGVAMETGALFSQGDVDGGRVVFVHEGGDMRRLSFGVAVSDGTAGHPEGEGEVRFNVYRADATQSGGAIEAKEVLRRRAAAVSRESGTTVWDLMESARGVRLDVTGAVRGQIFYGGEGDDVLVGGDGDDSVWGGGGRNSLTGGGGVDTFGFLPGVGGSDVVEDFSDEDGDVLDLRLVGLVGESASARDYVRVEGELLGIDLDGDGSGFTDRVIELRGSGFEAGDLRRLIDTGRLLLDGVGLPPLVTLEATLAAASENSPSSPARIEVTRSGATDEALLVELIISGSATNGVDYSLVDPVLVFLPGQRTAVLEIWPFADSVTEFDEVVEIRLKGASGYEVAGSGGGIAQISIADLMPSISLEAIEPLAVRNPVTPGSFLVSRSGVLDRGVFVRLNLVGTAASGSDYERVSPFLSLAPGQTSGVVQVVPKGAGGEPVSVVMEIAEDGAYLTGEDGVAEVVIVDELETFEDFLGGEPAGEGRLAAYAFGATRGAVNSKADGEFLEIDFRRNVAAVDLDYVVEVSGDLRSWRPGGTLVEDVTPPALLRGEVGRRVYRTLVAMDGVGGTYLRVRAVRK